VLGAGKAQREGAGTEGVKKRIDWCYTKYAIEEGTIADLQSEVTRAVMEVTTQARKRGLPVFT